MNDDEHKFVADRARATQVAIKALGVKRSPSGILRPTPEQVEAQAQLEKQWWAEVGPVVHNRWKELDDAHRAEMEKNRKEFEARMANDSDKRS